MMTAIDKTTLVPGGAVYLSSVTMLHLIDQTECRIINIDPLTNVSDLNNYVSWQYIELDGYRYHRQSNSE